MPTENGRNTAADCVKLMLGNGKWFQVKSRLLANIAVRTTHRTPHTAHFKFHFKAKQTIPKWWCIGNECNARCEAHRGLIRSRLSVRQWWSNGITYYILEYALRRIRATFIMHRNHYYYCYLHTASCNHQSSLFSIYDSRFALHLYGFACKFSESITFRFVGIASGKKMKWANEIVSTGNYICATSRTAKPFGIDRNSISVHRSQFATCSNNVRHVQLYQRILPKFILSWKMCQTHIHIHTRALRCHQPSDHVLANDIRLIIIFNVSMMRWKLNWTNVRIVCAEQSRFKSHFLFY